MHKPLILVVEDDTAVANLIATTLETQDYHYHRATTGAGMPATVAMAAAANAF